MCRDVHFRYRSNKVGGAYLAASYQIGTGESVTVVFSNVLISLREMEFITRSVMTTIRVASVPEPGSMALLLTCAVTGMIW